MGFIGLLVVLILGMMIFFYYPFAPKNGSAQQSAPEHAIQAADSVKGVMDARNAQTEAALQE